MKIKTSPQQVAFGQALNALEALLETDSENDAIRAAISLIEKAAQDAVADEIIDRLLANKHTH